MQLVAQGRGKGHGYRYVTVEGYIAFGARLREGAWAETRVPERLLSGGLDASEVGSLSLAQQWKLRLARSVHAACGLDGEVNPLRELDQGWDTAERRVDVALSLAELSTEANVAAAARGLRALLFPATPTGRSVTLLSYESKVTYGEAQLEVAHRADVASRVAIVGLQHPLSVLRAATRALGAGLGATPAGQRLLTLRQAQLQAHRECVATFNCVHDDMQWTLLNTAESPARSALLAMYETLTALLEAYPPAAPAAPAAATPTAPAAPGTPLSAEVPQSHLTEVPLLPPAAPRPVRPRRTPPPPPRAMQKKEGAVAEQKVPARRKRVA